MWCLRPWVSPLVLMLTIILVGYIVWGTVNTPETLWAPGHLSRHHTDITKCERCHQPFKGATNDKCLTCHTGGKFQAKAPAAVNRFHQTVLKTKQSCLECHTEHRGALASLTTRAMHNPHGEFVFRATSASSCSDCHTMNTENNNTKPILLQNKKVKDLIEEGEGAHQPGRFANCLNCHIGGQLDIDEEDEEEED